MSCLLFGLLSSNLLNTLLDEASQVDKSAVSWGLDLKVLEHDHNSEQVNGLVHDIWVLLVEIVFLLHFEERDATCLWDSSATKLRVVCRQS